MRELTLHVDWRRPLERAAIDDGKPQMPRPSGSGTAKRRSDAIE
jgi:hypothetical protein